MFKVTRRRRLTELFGQKLVTKKEFRYYYGANEIESINSSRAHPERVRLLVRGIN